MEKPQRRNALIAANAKKEKPKFGGIDFGGSPLEELDDEREKEIVKESGGKGMEPMDATGAPPQAAGTGDIGGQGAGPAAKKRGRKKSRQEGNRVVKTYNLMEEAVRYLEVYHMFHKEETPGIVVSEAIISYVKKKDPKVQEKIALLFGQD